MIFEVAPHVCVTTFPSFTTSVNSCIPDSQEEMISLTWQHQFICLISSYRLDTCFNRITILGKFDSENLSLKIWLSKLNFDNLTHKIILEKWEADSENETL